MNKFPQPFWVGVSTVALSLFFSWLSPHFLTGENFVTILDQSSINIDVAVGMTLVIASAGIDLSVGANVAVCGIVMASLIKAGFGVLPTIAAALLTGALLGLLNALLVVKLEVNPFMATLAMMSLVGGGALIVTQGIPIYGFSADFSWIGRGRLGLRSLPCSARCVATGGFLARCTDWEYTPLRWEATRKPCAERSRHRLYKTVLYVVCRDVPALASVILTRS